MDPRWLREQRAFVHGVSFPLFSPLRKPLRCFLLSLMAMVSFSFLATANGEEDVGRSPVAATASPPTSFSIPAEELYEWRILRAETQALQAESTLGIRERSDKLQALLILWKDRYKIDDMKDWTLDIENRSIKLNERNGTR